MKESAQKHIVDLFARTNHLERKNIPVKVMGVIAHAAAPFYLFVECLAPSGLPDSPNPIDGLLITLVKRMFDVVSGTVSLLVLGRPQQAEILSRTVMESALSLLYLAKADSGARLIQYFEHYIAQEREQNRKWQRELTALADERRADHNARISDKNEALDNMALFLERFAQTVGVKYPSERGYPNFLGICTALGKAIDYRTVYMAMCSQAHHDAEDILNDLIVGLAPNQEKQSAQLERETNNFSIFLVLHSIRYYLECLGSIGERYKFTSVEHQSSKSSSAVSTLLVEVSSGGFVSNPLYGWVPGEI